MNLQPAAICANEIPAKMRVQPLKLANETAFMREELAKVKEIKTGHKQPVNYRDKPSSSTEEFS